MKVTLRSEVLPVLTVETAPFDRSTGCIVYALQKVSELTTSSPVLWPAHGVTGLPLAEEVKRGELSRELHRNFHDMRLRAREKCPPTLLPRFEDELCLMEAGIRGAITGRLSVFLEVSIHIREVEDFARRWRPYLEPPLPPPLPPPRLQCDETDRSVWLDGKCLARELDRKQFAFLTALVRAYPDPVTWNTIAQTQPGCRGGNQSRLRGSLPKAVADYIESGPNGYGLRLPEKLSAPV